MKRQNNKEQRGGTIIELPKNNRYLPQDTFQTISSIGAIQPMNYKDYNFYYFFNLPQIIEHKPNKPEKIRINDNIANYKWDSDFLKFIRDRRSQMMRSLEKADFSVKSFEAVCPWRLVVGLGASHPQETSMTLHHIYGFPYIPGSAVKGVTRHWVVLKFAEALLKKNQSFEKAVREVSEKLESGEELDLKVGELHFKDLVQIFGTQKQVGKVIFMDAYPVERINLKMDIMNVHYSGYYSGDEPPADWQNPIPIKFLTVERTKFEFVILSKDEDQGLLNKTEKLLREALSEHGIGAKTSLGYGLFDISP